MSCYGNIEKTYVIAWAASLFFAQSLNPTFLPCMKLDTGPVFDFLFSVWIEDPDFSSMDEDKV